MVNTEDKQAPDAICIAVSACLLGEKCRYDRTAQSCRELAALKRLADVRYVGVCPEVSGGLPIPRLPSEIIATFSNSLPREENSFDYVVNSQGDNVTKQFIIGAHKTLLYAKNNNVLYAIMKSNSPSCGSGVIYDGTFSGKKVAGWGIAARMFAECGIKVVDEHDVKHIVDSLKAIPRKERQTQLATLFDVYQKHLPGGIGSSPDTKRLPEHTEALHTNALSNGQKEHYKPTLKKALGHACVITKHKMEVAKLCLRIGLVKQALTHDLSKYTPEEFMAGVRYFQGTRSPNALQREIDGHSAAWLHHKGRNKHHLEYWLDLSDDPGVRLCAAPMPACYVVEMFCDRVAASKTYKGSAYTTADPLNYYLQSKDVLIIHPHTRAELEKLLVTLADKGENEAVLEAKRYLLTSKQAE